MTEWIGIANAAVLLVVALSALFGLWSLYETAVGLSRISATSSMYERAPKPREITTRVIGAVLGFGFAVWIAKFVNTMYDTNYTNVHDMWAYANVSESTMSDVALSGLFVAAIFRLVGVIFFYKSVLSIVDAGKDDGSERGAFTKFVWSSIAGAALLVPDVTVSLFSAIPFAQTFALFLQGGL